MIERPSPFPSRRRGGAVTRVARVALRLALTAFFGVAAVQHVTDPGFFHPQYPDFLPAADVVIPLVGVLFGAGALGLLGPAATRRRAALLLLVLLVAVWPGNWWGAVQPGSYVSPGAPDLLDWLRVPFQPVIALAVVWANLDALRAPVVVRARTASAPAAVVAALTDFGPGRPSLFPTLDPARYTVHDLGPTWAEVTEGARPPGPVERERYDWSSPGQVRIETLESTAFRPGGSWLYRVGPDGDGGTLVELTVDRPPASITGWLVTAAGWYAGRRILARDLRRTLAAAATGRTPASR